MKRAVACHVSAPIHGGSALLVSAVLEKKLSRRKLDTGQIGRAYFKSKLAQHKRPKDDTPFVIFVVSSFYCHVVVYVVVSYI